MSNTPFSPNGVYTTSGLSSSDITAIGTSYTQLVSSTPEDWEGFYIHIKRTVATGDLSFDLAIGGSGSEVVIINDFVVSRMTTGVGQSKSATVFVPIRIPEGTRIAALASASGAISLAITGYNGSGGRMEGFADTVTYGVSSNRGVSVNAGATTNTKGAYTELTSSCDGMISGVYVMFDENNNTILTTANFLVDISIGAAGSEVVVIPDIPVNTHATDDMIVPFFVGPIPVEIPPGTRIAARCQSSTADSTDRIIGVSLLAVV